MARRTVYTLVECPRCGADGYLPKGAAWFRCQKCYLEIAATEMEVGDDEVLY